MAKIEKFTEMLEEYEGKELATKFLIDELGITSYYIGVLTHNGVIEKVKRGIYKVKNLSKTNEKKAKPKIVINDKNNGKRKPKNSFEKFRDLVLEESYEEAYDALVECCEANKENHAYDNHYRLYFILLNSILKMKGTRKKLDYDFENNLLEFYSTTQSEYYESYLAVREAILSSKYEEANEYMKIYADKEFRRHKENKVSTILSKKLLEEIVTMEENKKKSSEILNKAYKFIENKNYEEAKKLLEDIKIYLNAPRSKRLCKYLLELCQTILDFQKDETLILSDCKNYDFSEDISIARAFSTFMQNKDYLSANMYIDKCCELYKGGFYRLARILLEDLLDINKHHCFKTPPKNEIQELRIKTLKDDSKSNIHFSHFLGAMQNLDFDKAYEEIKLNLRYKVNAHTSSYTNSYNIYTMLKFLREMQESGKTLEEVRFVYLTNDSKQFNFNRAIRMQDWHSAYKFIPQEEIEKSLTLEAQYLLLKAIFRQDKINRGLELTEADELKPLSSHLKKDTNEEITKILTPKEEKVEVEKKEDVITIEISEEDCEKEILDSIKNLELNYKNLYTLVKNCEFEEAFALIAREEQKGYSIDDVTKELENLTHEEEKVGEQVENESSTQEKEYKENYEVIEENLKEEIAEQPRELTAKEKHKLAVLESIKDIELNYDNLYDLVYNKRYEEALYLIEREEIPNEQPSRLNFIARRLISQYLHITRGTFKEVEPKPIDYTQDCFKIFFAALNNRDYFLAYDYVTECENRTREPEEMRLFKLILGDICEEITRIEEEKRQIEEAEAEKKKAQTQIDNINKKLFALSNKQEFDDNDIRECQSLLSKKVEISLNHHLPIQKDVLILGATEAAYMALNNNLNDNHFATIKEETVDDEEVSYSIDTKSTKIGDIFYDALKCGDLLTVEKIITTENWDNFRDKMNNANLRLLKKLLSFMHEHMALIREREDERDILSSQKVPQELLDRSNALAYDLLSEKERMDYKKVELLRKLGSLVKRQNYNASLGEILESDVDISKDDQLLDITSDILVAKEGIKTEAHSLFEEFNKALQEKDTKLASEKLIEYSGYITSKSIDRDLAYHRKRIDIVEKDMKQANFEEKERLYSNALEMFYNKDKLNRLQKTISILNYYIELDNNINSKGYVLRARAYEKLKRIEEAKADYQKALQISPEPLALRALGKYAYEEGDYERAIYYLEKFQAIRPFKDEKVSRMLVTSYNSTGKEEKSLPFNRHLKHLNYISKK